MFDGKLEFENSALERSGRRCARYHNKQSLHAESSSVDSSAYRSKFGSAPSTNNNKSTREMREKLTHHDMIVRLVLHANYLDGQRQFSSLSYQLKCSHERQNDDHIREYRIAAKLHN